VIVRNLAGTREGSIVKVLRYISFSLFFSFIASFAAAQVNDTYVIPVSANVPGAFGTRWMTQFSVFNPQTQYPLTVSVTYLPTLGGKGIEVLFEVPPNSVAFSDNLLQDLYGVSGSGALLVATFPEDNPGVPNDVLSRAIAVTSNTYNNVQSGTYGQTVPGTWTGLQDFDTDGISAIAHGVRNIARLGWRTNVGATNLGRTSVVMYVTVYDADGATLLNKAPFTIPPMAHLQDRLPIDVDRGSIEFFVDDPTQGAVVFPYISTIDQLSGDPTYQTPVLLAGAKTLYNKGALAPQTIGTKIDVTTARAVRATASRIGMAKLTRTTNGLQITR
jgi:hypothetical protein